MKIILLNSGIGWLLSLASRYPLFTESPLLRVRSHTSADPDNGMVSSIFLSGQDMVPAAIGPQSVPLTCFLLPSCPEEHSGEVTQ